MVMSVYYDMGSTLFISFSCDYTALTKVIAQLWDCCVIISQWRPKGKANDGLTIIQALNKTKNWNTWFETRLLEEKIQSGRQMLERFLDCSREAESWSWSMMDVYSGKIEQWLRCCSVSLGPLGVCASATESPRLRKWFYKHDLSCKKREIRMGADRVQAASLL